jgi:cytochrome c oxidase subunit 4
MSGHISPKTTYYGIFGALMVLTAITVTVAFINLGALNFPVALGIAILKATLVILFFMHVKYSSRLTKLICGTAFFFLLILFGLTLSDYMSRGWFVAPGGTAAAGTRVTIGPATPVESETESAEPGAAPATAPAETPER